MEVRDQIIRQIDRLFGDTSQPASTTKYALECIRDHIDQLIDALDADGVASHD
ncbi:hypothetical protein [Paracoccus sp. SM22M-07]|uniref:hypothetical protein n=1 Tax=Paracoccus sp. SM22M-07 TaxID=1520813 RepID=UPI000A56B677|nr:hypothetical protein [Paracoccus sp. SM22M-07]